MAQPDCNFDFLWPGGVDCSGLGTCVLDNATLKSFCVCQDGISAIGDLIFDPLDCDQNEVINAVCWTFMLISAGICMIYGMIELVGQATQPKTKLSLFATVLLMTLSAFTAFLISLLKLVLVDPGLIGEDVLFSVLFPLSGFCYWVSIILFIDKLLSVIVSSANLGMIKLVSTRTPRYILLCLIGITFILPNVLCHYDQANCMDYVRIYFLGISFLIYIGGGFCMYYCHKLLQTLDDAFGVGIAGATNNPARQRMMNSLATLRSRLKVLFFYGSIATSQGFPLTIISLWPFLLRKVSYCIPVLSSPAYIASIAIISVLSSATYPTRRLARFLPTFRQRTGTSDKSDVETVHGTTSLAGVTHPEESLP